MVELALLALTHLGYAPVIAVGSVAAGAAELDEQLGGAALREQRRINAS